MNTVLAEPGHSVYNKGPKRSPSTSIYFLTPLYIECVITETKCEHKGDTRYGQIRKGLDISTCENDPTIPGRVIYSIGK
jgi:hypothetical protein